MQSNATHKFNSHWLKMPMKCSFWEDEEEEDDKGIKNSFCILPCPRQQRQVHYLVAMWNFVMTIYAMDGSFKMTLFMYTCRNLWVFICVCGARGASSQIFAQARNFRCAAVVTSNQVQLNVFFAVHTVTLKKVLSSFLHFILSLWAHCCSHWWWLFIIYSLFEKLTTSFALFCCVKIFCLSRVFLSY